MAKKRKTADLADLASAGNGLALDGAGPDNRRKKSAASRIGRACDRCQHRKLACDPSPGGCPPCQKVNAWCTVTDPLTGTPTYRGEFEYLERRVEKQQRDIEDLLARLRALGQDADYTHPDGPEDRRYNAWRAVKLAGDTRPWDRDERAGGGSANPKNCGPPPVPSQRDCHDGDAQPLRNGARHPTRASPGPRDTLAPENYVGLATARGQPVSSRLNMFGWEIDLANFTTPDGDAPDLPAPSHQNPVYDRSYRSGLASIYGLQPRLDEPELPSKQDMLHYAMTIIQVLNPFTPALHKGKYLTMINHVVDNPQANPTIAQKVILHMTVATIMLHSASRNQDEARAQLTVRADRHYHYSLGMFGHLLTGDQLEDVQALALICLFTRNLPKPEICWVVSHMAFGRITELSYHRAPRKKSNGSSELNVYETEMQKRLFWVIFVCIGVTSGKLGRPMPMRHEDYDVDVAASIPDDALSESGIDELIRQSQPCEFQLHVEFCKMTPTYMDVCSNIYTARPGAEHRSFVAETERRLVEWQDQLPDKYKRTVDDADNNDFDRMGISYLRFFVLEQRLLIHHPSSSVAKSAQSDFDELRVCLDISHDMLQYVKQMQKLRALEGTWHNCAIFILAIQTTLYAHGILKEELTAAKFEACRQDMTAWLSIMGDMGAMLGSKKKLQQKMYGQIQNGLAKLHAIVQSKLESTTRPTKDESPPRTEVKAEDAPPQTNGHPQTPQIATATSYPAYNGNVSAVNGAIPSSSSSEPATYGQPAGSYQELQAYQSLQQQSYPYPNPSPTSMPATSYASTAPSIPSGYSNIPNAAAYNMQQIVHQAHPSNPPATPYNSHAQPQAQPSYAGSGYYQGYPPQQASGADPQTTWLQYTQTLNVAGSPHSSHSGHAADFQPAAASALLQLGNAGAMPTSRDGSNMISNVDLVASLGNLTNYGTVAAAQQQWPLSFLDDSRNGYGQ